MNKARVINPQVLLGIACAITLGILVFIPINVSEHSKNIGPSPYRQEIDKLYALTSKGLPPEAPEWDRMSFLVEKNNLWFENKRKAQDLLDEKAYLIEKIIKLSPLLVVVWVSVIVILVRGSRVNA